MTPTAASRHASGREAVARQAVGGDNAAAMSPGFDVPRHSMDVELSWKELRQALGRLVGSPVVVRVVEPGDPEGLAVVLRGVLAPLRHDHHPTLFWPVEGAAALRPHELEAPGIYLGARRFRGALARVDGSVLVIAMGPLVINVRRADRQNAPFARPAGASAPSERGGLK